LRHDAFVPTIATSDLSKSQGWKSKTFENLCTESQDFILQNIWRSLGSKAKSHAAWICRPRTYLPVMPSWEPQWWLCWEIILSLLALAECALKNGTEDRTIIEKRRLWAW
jgi:hypothetical protein